MRLILRTKESLVGIYRIDGNANLVTGWYAGNAFRRELNLPDEQHFDPHFTYPKDGNYHLSFKSINEGHEEFISVYWDKVRIKTITSEGKTDIWMTRDEFANTPKNILGHLMVEYHPQPLNEVERFSFPTIGFNVFNGDFNRLWCDCKFK